MLSSEPLRYPIPPEKAHWREKTIQERKSWSLDCFIAADDTRVFINDVCERVRHIDSSSTGFGMLVLGGSGTGKTRLVKFLADALNARYGRSDPEKTVMPVIAIKIPEICTTHEVNVAILTALSAIGAQSKNKTEVQRIAKNALIACEVRLVLIDDFQDVPLRRGERGIDRIGTHIRDLMDTSRAVWVFLGTEESNRVRNSKNQLIKRIPYLHRLTYFDIDTKPAAVRFSRLLELLDAWLPLAEPSCFALKEFRALMFIASGGVFDRLIRLLDAAIEITVLNERESITREDLAKAFSKLFGSSCASANPFEASFVPRKLNQTGEPYEVLGVEVFDAAKVA